MRDDVRNPTYRLLHDIEKCIEVEAICEPRSIGDRHTLEMRQGKAIRYELNFAILAFHAAATLSIDFRCADLAVPLLRNPTRCAETLNSHLATSVLGPHTLSPPRSSIEDTGLPTLVAITLSSPTDPSTRFSPLPFSPYEDSSDLQYVGVCCEDDAVWPRCRVWSGQNPLLLGTMAALGSCTAVQSDGGWRLRASEHGSVTIV